MNMKRAIRLAYWRMGIDLLQPLYALSATHRAWKRPFDRLPIRGVGAEVGVYRGVHAKTMLTLHPGIQRLYLIDPYVSYTGEMPILKDAEACARRILRRFADRTVFVNVRSPHCALTMPALDFCYIDACHEYEDVLQDILAFWPKIKVGGVIGGYDFSAGFPGVTKAVCEFVNKTGVALHAETPDWWAFRTGAEKV